MFRQADKKHNKPADTFNTSKIPALRGDLIHRFTKDQEIAFQDWDLKNQ